MSLLEKLIIISYLKEEFTFFSQEYYESLLKKNHT